MTGPIQADDPAFGLSPETLTAQALGRVDASTRSLVPPLYPSSTFERDADGGYRSGRGYSRPHNPTYDEPEALLATLEGGVDCLLFSSGMAAATAVFQALLPGDHVIAPKFMYWALRSWLVDFGISWGLDVQFVDTTELAALQAAMRPGSTRLVWLDTPANPTWDVTDIEAAAGIAHGAGAYLAVDNTVSTPVLMRPMEWGADIVVHSATKYLNGHSDVVAGAAVAAKDDSYWQRVRAWRRDAGAVLGPFEAWLLLRGMRTLFVRVQRCSDNAMALAQHFEGHPLIKQVLYPGLPSHAGHPTASKLMRGGYGGMLSIRFANGEAAAMAVAANVKVFKRATSLGGVESLAEHRASIEGPATPVPGDLLRFSIGLENPADLIADLEQAIEAGGHLSEERKSAVPPPLSDAPLAANTVQQQVQNVLETYIRPLAAERGGGLGLVRVEAGTAVLAMDGSPGANLPLRTNIRVLLSHYIPQIKRVVFEGTAAPTAVTPGQDLTAALQTLIETAINPSLKTHGGRVMLQEAAGHRVKLKFRGGCQGCAMANLTLRQGIEPIIKEHLPAITQVIDVTEHSQGTHPYFKTKKS
ncbi:MAG: hypothetical protein GKR94_27490 [Gammaproteobacteria bacterium]|nr:hypothetical protein [Gammaproteobacteria bacterium]